MYQQEADVNIGGERISRKYCQERLLEWPENITVFSSTWTALLLPMTVSSVSTLLIMEASQTARVM